jgi:hypothetical protein
MPVRQSSPPKKSSAGIIVGVLGVVVIGAGALFLMKKPDSGKGAASVLELTQSGSPEGGVPPTQSAPAATPASSSSTSPPSPVANAGEMLTFGGHRYQLVAERLDWAKAEARAKAMGGHLATINSREESEWLGRSIIVPKGIDTHVRIGGSRLKDNRTWTWTTGESVDMSLWRGKGPDGSGPTLTFYGTGKSGLWDDVSSREPFVFLVEWDEEGPAMASTPAAGNVPGVQSPIVVFNGHRYQFVTHPALTHAEARAKAASMGAYLATLTSKEEDEFVRKSFAGSFSANLQQVWLGASREKEGNEGWRWFTGEPFTYAGWASGSSSSGKQGEGLALLFANGSVNWNVYRDAGSKASVSRWIRGFIVEWDDLGTSPPPGVTPVAVPTPAFVPAGDPRLAQLKSGFKSRYETDAHRPFVSALTSLNQSYVANGIAKARAAAQGSGSLPVVTALDAEKTSIEKGEGVPAQDAADTPEALKTLRATYRTAVARLEADRASKAAPLYDIYLAALDTYAAELTQQKKLDDARAVQILRGDIAEEKSSPAGASSSRVGATEQLDLPPSASDKPTARDIANWALSRKGGTVTVLKDGKELRATAAAALPQGRFEVVGIALQANEAADLLTDETLHQYIAAATRLKRFHVQNSTGITDRGMEAFRNLRELEQLQFTPGAGGDKRKNPGITDASFAHLASLINLRLLMMDCTGMNGAGVTSLASANQLERLSFSVGAMSSEGLRQVGTLKGLKALSMWWDKVADADLIHFKAMENLEYLDMNGCGITEEGLAHLVALKKLNNLNIAGCRTRAILKYARAWPALKILSAPGTSVPEAEWAELQAAMPGLRINK